MISLSILMKKIYPLEQNSSQLYRPSGTLKLFTLAVYMGTDAAEVSGEGYTSYGKEHGGR